MKKCLAVILALVYLSTSMGAALRLHYCAENPDICLSQVKGDCCNEGAGRVQAEHSLQVLTHSYKVQPLSQAVFPARTAELPDHVAGVFSLRRSSGNANPGAGKIPLFVRNCNLRI